MQHAPKICDDEARLDALRALRILDTLPEERFDRITRLARRLFEVPIALVSLVDRDRQWFKSRQGLDASETPRDISFCGHAVAHTGIFVVEDAASDDRFADNPLVEENPEIRFYAGYPIKGPSGHRLGTLCVIDREPRKLEAEDLELLADLGGLVEKEIANVALATMDELTGVTNRRGFEKLARHAIALCHRVGRPATLLYTDLDGFKQVNDQHGHSTGDALLQAFAGFLTRSFRDSDIVARLGGDEFAVLLTGTATDGMVRPLGVLAEQVRIWNQSHAERLAYSLGAVSFDPERHADLEALITEADRRMYQQKRKPDQPPRHPDSG